MILVCMLSLGTNAIALPHRASQDQSATSARPSRQPTSLPAVSTYTLWFGKDGATTPIPIYSRPTPTFSQSTSPVAIFPTVAPLSTTSMAAVEKDRIAAILPHSFVDKVDAIVNESPGITGRKARQVALLLTNQTDTTANRSRTNSIFSHLSKAYPSRDAGKEADVEGNITVTASAGAIAWSPGDPDSQPPHINPPKPGRSDIILLSNLPHYGPDQVRHDLHVIRAWADDLDQLSTPALLDETVAAIMSAAARYFPELSTRDAARVIMADIKAESDFDPDNVSGGRLDSGTSWGLMQVSPFGSAELKLFQNHAVVSKNTYSWDRHCRGRHCGAGPLLDWNTGKVLKLRSLTNEDLFRPWVNIHVASWIQSNLARTASEDPDAWTKIYRNISAVKGTGLPRTYLTGLGSWVAGPAVDGYGSYNQTGDDISAPYSDNIAEGLSVLYSTAVQPCWLDKLALHAGLVDFH